MFTAFLLQSVMVKDYTHSMAQLTWFQGVLVPRPTDPRSAIADPKGKGKATDTKGKGKARQPNPGHNAPPSKKPRGTATRPTGNSKKAFDHGEGPSNARRAEVSQRSHPVSSAAASHHTSESTPTSSSTSSDIVPDGPVDHRQHKVEYIVRHAFRDKFKGCGMLTGLGFLLKWVGYALNEEEPWWDLHAVLRMDPSYLTSYALWGPHGETVRQDHQTEQTSGAHSHPQQIFPLPPH
jgi:hypothetical protein